MDFYVGSCGGCLQVPNRDQPAHCSYSRCLLTPLTLQVLGLALESGIRVWVQGPECFSITMTAAKFTAAAACSTNTISGVFQSHNYAL